MNCFCVYVYIQTINICKISNDKNKRNAALFCNMKAKIRCVYCKQRILLSFCNFRFLCRLFSLVGHGEQIVENNLIINNCRMFSW